MMVGAALLPHAVSADSPFSHITPRTPEGRDIQSIYKLIFWLSLVVFIGVQAGIAYTALRYRRRSDDDERPEQVHGNKTLEIAWTILPAIVLLIIFIPTVRTIYAEAENTEVGSDDVVVEIYGKQWWWEVHYKQPTETDGVITANEIRIPQGKKVVFKLYSNNVIHSFWVPQLMGKMDLIPGHENRLAFTAEQIGFYWGQCAEFCGDSHANMQFKVIVEPQEQFDAWIAAWKAGPTQRSADIAGTGDVKQAPVAMNLCLTCHQINGTNLNSAQAGLDETQPSHDGETLGTSQTAGPNLTLFGCRTTIAAGILTNTPENLAAWLHDPGGIKPGNYMESQIKKGMLSDEAVTEIVGYLQSLRPEGGCPPITGEVLPENVASPAANEAAVEEAMTAAQNAQATAAAATATASAEAAAASATAAAEAASQPTAAPEQGGGQEQGAQPPANLEIDMIDINFNPKELTIPANTDVTINLKNSGAATHNFNLEAQGIHSGDYTSGQTGTIVINLPPGDYEYQCDIPGHKEAGMVGTLHVVEGAPAGGEQSSAPPADQGGAAAAPPEVDMVDIAFNPKELTIAANTDVTINLKNSGAATHNFNLEAQGIHSGDIAGGGTGSVVVNLPPGDYEYQCDIPGHKEAGMVGTLHVVEGGGAPAGGEQQAPPPDQGAAAPAPEVDMVDIAFNPKELTIPANTDVTINLKNSGAATHNFNLEEQGIHSGDIAGGGTGSVVVNLPPGEYEYQCDIPGHKEAGMVGKLIVQ